MDRPTEKRTGFLGTYFDRLSIPTLQLSQLAPGLLYFTLIKVAQQVLLITSPTVLITSPFACCSPSQSANLLAQFFFRKLRQVSLAQGVSPDLITVRIQGT